MADNYPPPAVGSRENSLHMSMSRPFPSVLVQGLVFAQPPPAHLLLISNEGAASR